MIRSNRLPRGPAFVDLELTNRCNLRCPMCWFHGENGIGDPYRHSEMDTDEILGLIDQIAEYQPQIYFGGAEPFIRDDFLAIISHARTCFLPVSFTTNGTLLNHKIVLKLVDLGVDRINFSIDGTEDIHDGLRGPGAFSTAISNLQRLLKCKKAANVDKPLITINLTINPLVVGHLKETMLSIQSAVADEVDSLRIHHLWFIGPTELQAHQAAIHEALGRSAQCAGSHRIPSAQSIDPIALADEISGLKGLRKVDSFPDLRGKEILDYYSEGTRSRRRCRAPFHAVVVKPNGDVRFCPDEWIDDYVLGNVREHSLETIWRSDGARHFRSVLNREGAYPGCKRCSWMYSF